MRTTDGRAAWRALEFRKARQESLRERSVQGGTVGVVNVHQLRRAQEALATAANTANTANATSMDAGTGGFTRNGSSSSPAIRRAPLGRVTPRSSRGAVRLGGSGGGGTPRVARPNRIITPRVSRMNNANRGKSPRGSRHGRGGYGAELLGFSYGGVIAPFS